VRNRAGLDDLENIKKYLFNNQPDSLFIQIYSVMKLYMLSGIFFTHHQEFSTVHSVLVSFMQFFDDRFLAESGWNCTGKFHAGF